MNPLQVEYFRKWGKSPGGFGDRPYRSNIGRPHLSGRLPNGKRGGTHSIGTDISSFTFIAILAVKVAEQATEH